MTDVEDGKIKDLCPEGEYFGSDFGELDECLDCKIRLACQSFEEYGVVMKKKKPVHNKVEVEKPTKNLQNLFIPISNEAWCKKRVEKWNSIRLIEMKKGITSHIDHEVSIPAELLKEYEVLLIQVDL